MHLLIALLLFAVPTAHAPGDTLAVPADTPVPVRFLTPVESGTTRRGWTVEAQSMADVTAGQCVVIPAYSRLLGIVDESLAGWFFRRRGRLHLTFEDANVGPGAWLPVTAVVEDVEWLPPHGIGPGGQIQAVQGSVAHTLVHDAAPAAALMPVAGEIAAPVGVISTAVALVRRGARVRIRAGDEATLRLTSPLRLPPGAPCRRASLPDPATVPAPADSLPTRTRGGNGEPGDILNLIFEGTEADLVGAFGQADWVAASSGGLRRIGAAGAVVLGKSDAHAPVSPQRLFGRVEDLAFERQGPNARRRHHVRIWAVDSSRTLWIGAANEDVGVYMTVVKPRVTHRMAPELDAERDLLARELEAGGCAVRLGYARIPSCPLSGRNSSGEEFTTDGRAAVIRMQACGGS